MRFNDQKILIVSKESIFIEAVSEYIAHNYAGNKVIKVDNAEQILLDLNKYDPSIIIIDNNIVNNNIYYFVEEITELAPDIPLVVICSVSTPIFTLRCLELGVSGVISKSISLKHLVTVIECILAGDVVVTGEFMQSFTKALRHNVSVKYVDGKFKIISPKEVEVLRFASEGLTNKEISDNMKISERTVQSHFTNIFCKLNARSRTEAVIVAHNLGYLSSVNSVKEDV
jgi:NarL family two-component system response regulator LiaR